MAGEETNNPPLIKSAYEPLGVGLLDVNVLVALVWPNHQHHQSVRVWFKTHSHEGWATTPITESGLVRISTNRSVLTNAATPPVAVAMLQQLTSLPGHRFWADTVQGVVGDRISTEHLSGHQQITDAHLLTVCIANNGHLVTLDTKLANSNIVDPRHIQIISDSN